MGRVLAHHHTNVSLPAEVLWSSFVTHSFLTPGPWRNECVTNEPKGRLRAGYFATLRSYIFARLRRITFKLGNNF